MTNSMPTIIANPQWRSFLKLALPLLAALGLAGWAMYAATLQAHRHSALEELDLAVERVGLQLAGAWRELAADVSLALNDHELKAWLNGDEDDEDELESEFQGLARVRGYYRQVQLLSVDGKPLVRVHTDAQGTRLLSRDAPQPPQERAMLAAASSAQPGEVMVFPPNAASRRSAGSAPATATESPVIRLVAPLASTTAPKTIRAYLVLAVDRDFLL